MSLEMQSVSVYASGNRLLSNISLACPAGKVVGIIGENGAGKSTILNVLSGLTQADAGRVTLDGRLLSRFTPAELAALRAVLPQSSELSFPLDAIEVVRLALNMSSCTESKQEAVLNKCLQQFDVSHLAYRNYLNLSGGEKQRVHLARVMAQLICNQTQSHSTSQYLLLDEPISALDLNQQFRTMKNIRQLSTQGIGVIAILHDINLASMFCDHLVVLKSGNLLTQGTPKDVVTEKNIESAFEIDVSITTHPDTHTPFLTPRMHNAHSGLPL